MLGELERYVILLAISTIVGLAFKKSPIPSTLFLVVVGIGFSMVPGFSTITLDPELVLDVFLPLLIYEASAESSWRDIKVDLRPILWLSIGHVIFTTFLVAVVIHTLMPQFGWPLAFVLGAIISPPDDVAIIAIAEKVHMPVRVQTILKSEGMLNDAAALILFRFSLAAVVTHEFLLGKAISTFLLIIIGETLYGLTLGYIVGRLREKIQEPILQMMVSLLTPFVAYLPAERIGGCGILATAVVGMIIGHRFVDKFPAEVRLANVSIWPTLNFGIQGILFLLVGLNLRSVLERISSYPPSYLLLCSSAVIFTVVMGRFIWVYLGAYLPRLLLARKTPPAWQYPFVISWAGMRGGVSLAAALAIPALPIVHGIHPKDLLLFLVFCVIGATLLLQGFTLPWVLKALAIPKRGQREKHHEYFKELSAKLKMVKAVLVWLETHQDSFKDNHAALAEIHIHIQEYQLLKKQLMEKLKKRDKKVPIAQIHSKKSNLLFDMIEVERKELAKLWQQAKITHSVKNKLLLQLDYRTKQAE